MLKSNKFKEKKNYFFACATAQEVNRWPFAE